MATPLSSDQRPNLGGKNSGDHPHFADNRRRRSLLRLVSVYQKYGQVFVDTAEFEGMGTPRMA
jgi:hypothetical protein